jgi:hypothetical protein
VPMVLRLPALAPRHRVGIVEADQPLAVRSMQRERIIEAVWFVRRYRHSPYDELHPMTAIGVHHEQLPVEIEKCIESRVARLRHTKRLSH